MHGRAPTRIALPDVELLGEATGTLPMDRIASGAILNDKINDLAASKLTGTLSNDRLSNVPATKLDLALGLSDLPRITRIHHLTHLSLSCVEW